MTLPRLASSAIVQRGDTFLLVRRARAPAANCYAFPGGRAEPGETPAETALRELTEETGLVGFNPQLFAFFDLQPEPGVTGSHYHLSVFRVETDMATVAQAQDDAIELGWFAAPEIARLPVPPSVLDCIERLCPTGAKD